MSYFEKSLFQISMPAVYNETFCFTSTQARWPVRVGDREVGWGEGGKRVKARPRAPTRKTEEAVDRRQNDGSVKAVSPRHCAATSVLRNCCFGCCAGQGHKDNVRCTAVE